MKIRVVDASLIVSRSTGCHPGCQVHDPDGNPGVTAHHSNGDHTHDDRGGSLIFSLGRVGNSSERDESGAATGQGLSSGK